MKKFVMALTFGAALLAAVKADNIVDEVVWIVGDQPIYRSEVEETYQQMQSEGQKIDGNPYCVIPEQLAVEKLYLHQAKIDTIEPAEAMVAAQVDKRINFFIANLGSKEKVEEMFRKKMPQIKEQLTEIMRNNYITQEVQEKLTKDVKGTPKDVRTYYQNLPADSIPYVPLQVEVQIIKLNPPVARQEVEDVKSRLREYADRVNNGEVDFSTLAIMYSEDEGSRRQGGELGFHGKADFVPEFSNVAFNLNDPSKVSRIVETEYGYHIIQLIEKRGDQINCRHILLQPKVGNAEMTEAVMRLDSLRTDLSKGKFTFEEAARYVSQDKDTRNNNGLMMNPETRSSKFQMQDLPVEVARHIENMNPGDVSEAFIMKDATKNRDVVVLVKLKDRVDGHRATLRDDYNLLKQMYENSEKEQRIKDWVEKKIKETYVRIEDGWNECDFRYQGWIK